MCQVIWVVGLDLVGIVGDVWLFFCVVVFVEVYIEQGLLLFNEGLLVGVVIVIFGVSCFMVEVCGLVGYVGMVFMYLCCDVVMVVVEIGLYIECCCGIKLGLVGIMGILEVVQGVVNVVLGLVGFFIDICVEEDVDCLVVVVDVCVEIECIVVWCQVEVVLCQIYEVVSVFCVLCLQVVLVWVIEMVGWLVCYLFFGVGYDVMVMVLLGEVVMLFVCCGNGGISYYFDEIMSIEDVCIVVQVFCYLVE